MLGNSPEITDKAIKKIINSQLDIKLRQFTEEELDTELKKKITKNYRYNSYCFLIVSNLKLRKFFGKIRMVFVEINPLTVELLAKNLEGTILFINFSKAFDSIEMKDGTYTTRIWSPERNCYCYNDALQKHEGKNLLT